MRTTKILQETMIPFADGKKLPIPTPPRTLRRWRDGLVSKVNGQVVTLDWCYVGGIPYTSKEAYYRFMGEYNADS